MKICLSCEGISATELPRCGSCGTDLLPIEAVHYPLRRGEEDAGNPLLGSRVDGKFRVTNVLGKGGMGTVFRAVHEVSLVPVALKILHARYAARGAYRDGFLAEARKAGRVIHDNCARILDVGEAEDGTVYIAQELVEGETLDEWIHAGLTPATAVEILVQLCRAVVAAHAVGLVHRDLSTRNVMVLLRDGRPLVKVLDFGIAKGAPSRPGREEEGGGLPVTASFANPAYSAPEQLAGRDVDARADLYSLGVIAYEALTGELPVAGATGRELARATVEGHLKELPALPGVPVQLRRLVQRLLARDPRQRPATAAEVLQILENIRRPKGLALKRAAVGLLIAAVVLITVAYTAVAPETYLSLRPGESIVLSGTLLPDRPVQEVRSQQLESLTFDFAGFDPSRLRVQVFRGSELEEFVLEPVVGPDGSSLTLSTDEPGYRDVLQRLAGEGRALDLTFRVDNLAPLGYARLLVDDLPPDVSLVQRDQGSVLTPRTELAFAVKDSGTPARVWLELAFPGGRRETTEIELARPWVRPLDPTALFQDVPGFDGVAAIEGPFELRVRAVDLAGNVTGSSPAIEFDSMDLGVPAIERVGATGGGTTVTYGSAGTTLRLTLDRTEPDLKVRVRGPDAALRECAVEYPGGRHLDVQLHPSPSSTGPSFADGSWEFQLVDLAGNESNALATNLSFRPRAPQMELSNRSGNAAAVEGLVYTDGNPAELHLECNEPYRLQAASAQRGGVAREVPWLEEAAGSYTLTLGAMEDGRYRLVLTLRDLSQESGEDDVEAELLVRRSPPVLLLPDTRGARFLRELVDSRFFSLGPDGTLEEGTAWNLQPLDWRILRGEVWFGTEGSSYRHELPLAPDEKLFPALLPPVGDNRLDLELRDLLGRPVRVLLDEYPPVPIRPGPDGTPVYRVAEFVYQSRPPTPRELRVEHGQPARLVIDSPLVFTPQDEILLWAQSPVPPRRIERGRSGGTELEFELRFQDLEDVVDGLRDVDREDFGGGRPFTFEATLATPAGEDPLLITLKTSRSVLPEIRLGEMPGNRPLPEALAALRMVPALAPSPLYADPVRADLKARALYRPAPVIDVRTGDVYLQYAELTRAQYAAAVRAFLELPTAEQGSWIALVHAGDPLGAQRLTETGLRPAALDGGSALWQEMQEQGDRPVTGVDFFQAYTLTRIVGLLVLGNPELLRLPLGVELEMAALGTAPESGPALNGLVGVSCAEIVRAHEQWKALRDDPASWPPTATESEAIGDFVDMGQGFRLVGLDFGVREWVLDLPYNAALDRDEALLREWMADQRGHVERALAFARGSGGAVDVDLSAHLATFGVARGVALGEPDQLVDGDTGERLSRLGGVSRPASLPGVVRVLQLRRDGQDLLPDLLDPRLRVIGLRLAGGDAFVSEVRAR